MATSIQVNANTQQAQGAFNALSAAIDNTNGQIGRLNISIRTGSSTNQNYSRSTEVISSSFDKLSSAVGVVTSALAFATGIVTTFYNAMVGELDKLQGFNAIMLVSAKSTDEAAASYSYLRQTADQLGLRFDDLSSNYAKLVAALPDGNNKFETARKVFLGIAEASRTLHATNQDTQLMFYAITQMASKGVVSMEELRRQLGEKLPGTLQIAARATNTTVQQLVAAISKGSVDSVKFLNYFGDELIRTFTEPAEKASTSVSASINRLTNVWVDFVKSVLDSGAGQAIIGVFDALREKLSDPYVIAKFSELVKDLGERLIAFIQSITADDIRNGFDSFAKLAITATQAVGKLIESLQWILDHGPQAGAVVGGVLGAYAGARLGGGIGAVLGAAAGAAGGAQLGKAYLSDDDLKGQQQFATLMQAQAEDQKHREAEQLKNTQLLPLLSEFKGLKSLDGLDNLFKEQNLTLKTLDDLLKIRFGGAYKTDADQAKGVLDYAKYGQLLNSPANGLEDITNGKSKPNRSAIAAQRSEDATYNKAIGFNPDFDKEMSNLNKLVKDGRLSLDEYDDALVKLLDKQPFAIEQYKQEQKALDEYNRGLEKLIDSIVRQSEVQDQIRTQLDDEDRTSKMRQEDLAVETEAINLRNKAKKVGKDLDMDYTRDRIRTRREQDKITGAADDVLRQTVDRYEPQRLQQRGMDQLAADPSSGFKKQDQTDFTVGQDPNMQGSMQWIEAQKRQLDDYYSWIDGLRNNDVISEQTAQQAKAQANASYVEQRVSQDTAAFSTLASLASSGNKRIQKIGQAAALADATIQGILAVQRALAAPPGWPYNAANVVAVGVVQASNVAAIASQTFQTGGYTGNLRTDEVAGVVHGQEFVVNASATAKNRAALEAMNKGQSATASSGGSTSSGSNRNPRITVHNYGPPMDFSVKQLTADEVEVIAKKQVEKHAPRVVSKDMYNPNSDTSKALARNTQTSRKR